MVGRNRWGGCLFSLPFFGANWGNTVLEEGLLACLLTFLTEKTSSSCNAAHPYGYGSPRCRCTRVSMDALHALMAATITRMRILREPWRNAKCAVSLVTMHINVHVL